MRKLHANEQKQLLAFARALLKMKETNLVFLDEASSSLDHETDAVIQRLLRTKMAHATILCVAHRLDTIIDYDRILVFAQGRVVEDDTPARLLRDRDSTFSALVRETSNEDALREMAFRAERSRLVDGPRSP